MGFLDSGKNVMRLVKVFFALCAGLLVLEVFLPVHGEFFFEDAPGFYAAFGLVACVTLVLGAKHILRGLVKRDEDYYEREGKSDEIN